MALAESVQKLATEIHEKLATKSPVDLAKLLFRLRADVSLVPAALLGVESRAERVQEHAPRGEVKRVAWRVSHTGRGPLPCAGIEALATCVRSPWPEVAKACNVGPEVTALGAERAANLQADLFVPANPPRSLLPYLLEVRGRADGRPFTIVCPVDVLAGHPLAVAVQPERVVRGQERTLLVTVKNRLQTAGRLLVKFTPPRKTKITPAELKLDVAAKSDAAGQVRISVDQFARLGTLRIPYTIAGDNAKFKTTGFLELSVSGTPIPRVRIKRVQSALRIDGKLDEPAWRAPATVPELRLLSNAGPATEKTAVWAAYSDKGLYVAMRCQESQMHKLKAKFADRGAPLYQEDDVEIFILTHGAGTTFQFAVNALGTRSDNFGNKTDWLAAAQQAANAWTVEAFIPYRALGLSGPPRRGASWAVQFGRQQKAKRETTSWTPGRAFNVPEGFGEIVFD